MVLKFKSDSETFNNNALSKSDPKAALMGGLGGDCIGNNDNTLNISHTNSHNDNNSIHPNHLRPHKLTRPTTVDTNDRQLRLMRKWPMSTATKLRFELDQQQQQQQQQQPESTTITQNLVPVAGAQFVATQTERDRRRPLAATPKHCYRYCHVTPLVTFFILSTLMIGISQQSSLKISYLPDNTQDSLATTKSYMDAECFGAGPDARPDGSRTLDAHKIIYLLKCDIFPLFRTFAQLLPQLGGPSNVINSFMGMDKLMALSVRGDKREKTTSMWTNYLLVDKAGKDKFFDKALVALDKREFCTFPTVSEFSNLRRFVEGSEMLTYIYDIITIDFHSYCLADALGRFPEVPFLVREVVDIYLTGADQQVEVPDEGEQSAGEQILGDEQGLKEFRFDVNEAIEKNGGLDTTVGLVFSMSSNKNTVEGFKSSCKEFLIVIGERWQSMEMMSKLLNTSGNGIERLNNYIMRRLIPTKYADICTQLSNVS